MTASARITRSLEEWLLAYEAMQRAQAPLRAAVINDPDLRAAVAEILDGIDQVTPEWKWVFDALRELARKVSGEERYAAQLGTLTCEPEPT